MSLSVEWTKLTPSPAPPPARYQRFVVDPVLDAWIYRYDNPKPFVKQGAVSTGIEMEVQLAGEWTQVARTSGRRVYTPGSVRVLAPGELYSFEQQARHAPGLSVGFLTYREGDGDATWQPRPPDVGSDRRLVDLARAIVATNGRSEVPAGQIACEIRAYVEHRFARQPPDALAVARREIERTFDRELYVHHFAETAAMSPVTFSRAYARRFGLTPIRFRLELRLNAAARMLRNGAKFSVEAVAVASGFNDLPYFHRAFRARFGRTPGAYATWTPYFSSAQLPLRGAPTRTCPRFALPQGSE